MVVLRIKLKSSAARFAVRLILIGVLAGTLSCQSRETPPGSASPKPGDQRAGVGSPEPVSADPEAGTTATTELESIVGSEVLNRMRKVYAECQTYRDSGAVSSTVKGPGASGTKTHEFTTAFQRPARFRIVTVDTKDDGEDRKVVWRSGAEFNRKWNLRPNLKNAESFDLALTTCYPAAEIVPSMLMNDVLPSRTIALKDVERRTDEMLDGRVCYVIVGATDRKEPVSLFIDQSSFLLRRMNFHRESGPVSEDRTITWQPEVDAEITDAELQLGSFD